MRTKVQRVEIANRPLRDVVQEIVKQIENRDPKKPRIHVLFSPERLGDKVREISGGVFGNPPIEGNADEALFGVARDYICQFAYVKGDVLLFYDLYPNGNAKGSADGR